MLCIILLMDCNNADQPPRRNTMTDAEKWMSTHDDVPTMTECEDLGFPDGYDDDDNLVIIFPDCSRLVDGIPKPDDHS